MIIWRNGKAGLIGGIKRLIIGFFDVSHSATSEAPAAPTITSYYTVYSIVAPIESVSMAKKITKMQTGVPIIGVTSK